MPTNHFAIMDLLHEYTDRIDRGDFESLAELFADGSITAEGVRGEAAGRDAVLAMYTSTTRRYGDGTPRTKHVITNPIIEVDEPAGTATSRSYFTVLQQVDDLPLQPVIAGRYRDAFERVDGTWRFSRRHITSDLYGDLSRHLLIDVPKRTTSG